MSMSPHRLPILLLALLLVAACAAPQVKAPRPKPGTASYTDAAQAVYDSGVSSLASHDYIMAQQRLEEVRTRYPYSKFAPLAELRIADGYYAQGKYLEAADAYRSFARLRPSHAEVDYAAFRVGLALWKMAPSKLFIFPPSWEKDLTQVREALTTIEGFLAAHPESQYAEEAKGIATEARQELAQHELYVAEFYGRRGKWRGVAGRLETVLRDFGDLPLAAEARVELAEAYLQLHTPRVEEARRLLGDVLSSEAPDDLKARARSVQERLPEVAARVEDDPRGQDGT